MAESGLNPQQIQYMVAAMQNPQAAMQLQQQNQLAQQMMQQGAEQPNPNETINEGIGGAHTVPFNKWGGLARAGEQMTGAYLQNQNNQKLGSLMANSSGMQSPQQSPTGDNGQPMPGQLLPWQSNAATGGMGAAPQQPSTGNIKINPQAPVTGNVMQDALLASRNQEAYKAAVANKYAAVNAGAVKAAETAQTPVNMNGHMTFMTPPAMQQGQQAPQMPPQTNPQGNPAITPQSPAGQQALGDMYGTKPAAPVNLTTNGQQNVDWNNPAAAKGAEAEATKEGENIGDTEKTYNVVSSQLPRAIQRFQELRAAAHNASYGPGLTPAEGGGVTNREQFANMFEPQTAKANQMIGQISSQGILPEIGPVIASTGGRGNQFMEKMASSASGIRLTDNPQVKAQAIDNIENQYVGNLKSQAAILRNAGRPALSDDQIDAMVVGYKAQNPTNNQTAGGAGGTNWVRQNGKLVQQ